MSSRLSQALHRAPIWAFTAVTGLAAFSVYFAMYAVRKPYAAAYFPGHIGDLELKIALVTAQIIGYALSKFIGIRVVSEISRDHRGRALLIVISIGLSALAALPLLPDLFKPVALFVNGLVLGNVWGLVFSYLEGRRNSELLGAVLSTSYIVASGATKGVGRWLLNLGLAEVWMPIAVGLLFLPVFVTGVWVLEQVPRPSVADEDMRTRRVAMKSGDRSTFFRAFAPGFVLLTAIHVVVTAYRDFRDNFAVEIFRENGLLDASVLTSSELWVAPVVLLCLALVYRIGNNRTAFLVVHGCMGAGTAIIGLATLAFQWADLSAYTWMVLVGLGLYLAYVPYGTVLFDRLIAAQSMVATSVYMIYVTDAFGNVGAVSALLFKNFGPRQTTWTGFFVEFSYFAALSCTVGFALSWLYFWRKMKR